MDAKSKTTYLHELIAFMTPFVTGNKLEVIDKVILDRTRHITLVFEDLYRMQNISAVIRTAECFGIQDIHAIERRNSFYMHKKVTRGASKWIDIYKYNEFIDEEPAEFQQSGSNPFEICYKDLTDKGYQFVSMAPSQDNIPIEALDLSRKTAFVFGNELDGVSKEVREKSKHTVCLPMYGFTESYNISVSVAILLNTIFSKIREKSNHISWEMGEEERLKLKLRWIKKVVTKPDSYIATYLKKENIKPEQIDL